MGNLNLTAIYKRTYNIKEEGQFSKQELIDEQWILSQSSLSLDRL